MQNVSYANADIPPYCLLTWVEKHFTHDKNHPVNSLERHYRGSGYRTGPLSKEEKEGVCYLNRICVTRTHHNRHELT